MRNRIDEVLKEQGKTYKDLVPLTGLNEYEIGQMAKAGDDETFWAWLSIARALDVSPAYLVGWSDNPSEEDPDTFKDYVNNRLELESHYDFAQSKPTSGVKVTLDDGRVIYDSREVEFADALLAETSGNSNIKTIDLHKYLRED